MPIVSTTNSSMVRFEGQEVLDIMTAAAVAAGGVQPDGGEVEDSTSVVIGGDNLGGYSLTDVDVNSLHLTINFADAEGAGTTPV